MHAESVLLSLNRPIVRNPCENVTRYLLTLFQSQIQRQGIFATSFIPLFAAIATQLICDFTPSRIWFAALCAASTFVFSDEQDSISTGERKRMRFGRLLTLIAVISFGVLTILHLREPYERSKWGLSPDTSIRENLVPLPAPEPLAPKAFPTTNEHPIAQLIRDADASWDQLIRGQSSTLEEAVAEYKRRYNIPPPPNFDKWYTFARLKGVQLIDEFDTVYKTLLPFWGMAPATIRARAQEAIGYQDNMLMGLAIRDGEASVVQGGQDWLQQAAVGMINDFVQWLPDMDLAFNTHDEPRVVVPHDDLSRLVQIALDENMPKSFRNPTPRNSYSPRPNDINSGRRFPECKTTRFNWYAHQSVWDPSRLSCAPSTPARALDETQAADNLTAYALGELGFIYNQTAFSDICNSPSLATSFGFFERPNAFNTAHDLFPIFSQSKISSFQDILYPSPWYWWDKVPYNSAKDLDWKAKIPKLFWRGSTTGGFSRAGGWRRQHRQNFVGKLNALDQAKILQDTSSYEGIDVTATRTQNYRVKEVARQDYKDSIDVHFSHIGQCDPGDCDAQREFFTMKDGVEMQDHWKWKFLLDIDGNAFSGRFYAFLKSKSLALKMSIFREWHQEWLRPWVHYVPLSLRGDEVLESVRFLSAEGEGGKPLAEKVAEQGREWAGKALRNEDFEVWFFRVLLEYGRVVDDGREEIGYGG